MSLIGFQLIVGFSLSNWVGHVTYIYIMTINNLLYMKE
jgi:hypothetical protein